MSTHPRLLGGEVQIQVCPSLDCRCEYDRGQRLITVVHEDAAPPALTRRNHSRSARETGPWIRPHSLVVPGGDDARLASSVTPARLLGFTAALRLAHATWGTGLACLRRSARVR